MPKKSTATIDPASADVVLAYVDDERGRSARNAPRRHLTHNDIARLAFEEALLEVARDVGQPVDRKDPDGPLIARPDPRDPDPARVAAIVDELLESGYFSTDLSGIEAPPESPSVPEPAAPADSQEAPA